MTTNMQALDSLNKSLSELSSKDDKKLTLLSFLDKRERDSKQPLNVLFPSPNTPKTIPNLEDAKYVKALDDIIKRHGLQKEMIEVGRILSSRKPLEFGTPMPPPLSRLSCANQDTSKSQFCYKDGTMSCSGCLLVRYCSKECQLKDWRSHKYDCRNMIRSPEWSPAWVREKRTPKFIDNDDTAPGMPPGAPSVFGMGLILWGNTAAIDIVNAVNNEGVADIRNRDLSLAFIASGDLRNVVRTINELPGDYAGTIKIVLNDFNPIVVSRNLMILSILGIIEDVEEAAEHALHLWYSIFQPLSYETRIYLSILQSQIFRHLDGTSTQLTPSTTMYNMFSSNTVSFLLDKLRPKDMDPPMANNALNDIMNAPEREDYRDRYYARMKPSHRLAFKQWRSYGLILPFGAINAHMAIPNPWVFTQDGRLMLSDNAHPFDGWDFDEMFNAGKAHGTTEEDLIGCLFFYVKDQLVEFSKRLRRFKIQIYSFDQDARDLLPTLKSSPSFPQRFDRIEVSNIVDKNYVGMSVLTDWGPLLNEANPHAAIIGHFMNWPVWKESAKPLSSSAITKHAMKRMSECPFAGFSPATLSPLDRKVHDMMKNLILFHDTSKSFEEYLKDEKEGVITSKAGLQRRPLNRIAPHRCYAKLGVNHSELPHIDSSERWYKVACLSGMTHYERYVEWGPVSSLGK
ncbi:uncharacterized protein EV420DRAFT_1558595 [Desarmillaria tabescens]|uniref:MYND-type domain-containing protein n=1 Tax=Armillaria tabescens TaxID=1929756 RepID=A0AA39MZN2_ARMTA|nr:uncharacterized protein EV420DRAFT_1558595 [Desarmillaria tabescens]KAK0452836.1 hypothetical protein EV420DRAFT_1558595 [Desarmillaria tabescens]